MTASRRVAFWAALMAWLYSWILFRTFRSEAVGSGLPTGSLVLMGITSTILIGAAVAAGMKTSWWPIAALLSGVLFLALVVFGQQALMNNALEFAGSPRRVTFGEAFQASLRTRTAFGVTIVAALPTLLILAGGTGLTISTSNRKSEPRE